MSAETGLTVGALATLAGVTIRTLHHYDELGLLSPGGRTASGYRMYGPTEVARLQEVLFFRELGFGLDEIRQMVDRPGYDRVQALADQRRLLEAKAHRLLEMVESVDRAIEAERTGIAMTPDEMLDVFGDFDPSEYREEVEERWGDTDAYRESNRRVAGYGKADWERIGKEAAAINDGLVVLMQSGAPAHGPEAMDLAEAHRAHISKWFYECTPEIHTGLGEMYVADPRFKESINESGEGLAEYLSQAIAANARR